MHLTFLAIFLPFKILAAVSISEILPFVHEPITTWSIFIFLSSLTSLVFSGKCGHATVGSIEDKSISIIFS